MIRLNLFMIWFFALSFLIISYLQVLSSKFIKSNHCCFSIYSFHAFFLYSQTNPLLYYTRLNDRSDNYEQIRAYSHNGIV